MARNRINVDEQLETPFNFAHLKRSLKYVAKYKNLLILALVFNIITSLALLVNPILLGKILDKTIVEKNMSELITYALIILLMIVVYIVFALLKAKITNRLGQNIIFDIRQDIFKHIQSLPFSYYDNRPYGKILVRVVNYVNNVADMLSNGLILFVVEILNIIFIIFFMLATNVTLALVIFSGLPFLIFIAFILQPIQRKMWRNLSAKFSNFNAYISESINGVKISQIFTREEENQHLFMEIAEENRQAWLKTIRVSATIPFFVENIQNFILMAVYVVGVYLLSNSVTGALTIGTLFIMTNYAGRFWAPITSISNIYNNFINTISYLERIFETLDEKPEEDDDTLPNLPEIIGDVEFKNVTFGYLDDDIVLDNVSFKVKAGESVALVGPTGSGKTTIVNLLSKFYKIRSGEILVDGHNICEYNNHSLRSQMGIMLQDSFIFSGKLKDNIIYAKRDATAEEIARVLDETCLTEFVNKLEGGLDFEINEGGTCLSGGYKQLISFARTVITDPKILILDEATSSIDSTTEKLVVDATKRILNNRTSFIVAHRLSTIVNCDKIMFIKNGKITEIGNHSELMKLKGDYYNLYTSQ